MREGPIAPASRDRLEALHRRFAGRLRTAARWLGIADDERDAAVARCFRAIAAAVPADMTAGWAALMRRLASATNDGYSQIGPRGPGEAALLAFLRARRADERAVFALAELGGFDATELARAIGAPPASGQALIVGLRRAFAGDPAVIAAGGPAAALREAIEGDRAPAGWRAAAWADLEGMFIKTWLSGQRAGIVGVAALAIALIVVLRPARAPKVEVPQPAATAPVHEVAEPEPPPEPAPPPAILPPAPVDMVAKPDPERKLVVRKKPPRKLSSAQQEREAQASARDPGNVIVELEMLGAAKKALAASPGQALAYADQHARDYPNSQLAVQRAEVRVRALCALGRVAEARAEALRRPDAKVQNALREACKGP